MTEEMHEDDNICVLVDEEGKEWEFEIVDVFEKDDKRYALLVPADEEAEDEETGIFLRIEQDENGDDIFEDLEDEEFDAVAEFYESLLEEEDEE